MRRVVLDVEDDVDVVGVELRVDLHVAVCNRLDFGPLLVLVEVKRLALAADDGESEMFGYHTRGT